MSTGMLIAAIVAGGAWRWWDGRSDDWHPSITQHTLVRLFIVAVLAALIGYDVLGDWGLLPAAVAVLSIHMSPYKFLHGIRSWLMPVRYALPAMVSVIPSWFGVWQGYHGGQAYILACLIAGASYPVLHRWGPEKLAEYGPEFLVGAAVIGGLAIL